MKTKFMTFAELLAFVLMVIAIPLLIVSTTVQIYAHSADLYKAVHLSFSSSRKRAVTETRR